MPTSTSEVAAHNRQTTSVQQAAKSAIAHAPMWKIRIIDINTTVFRDVLFGATLMLDPTQSEEARLRQPITQTGIVTPAPTQWQ
jgi:hypothetical protein